jgi:hypothetical protein
LIKLLLQRRAYAHKIALSWYNTRDIHVGTRLNKCNKAVRKDMMAIWQERSNGPQGLVRPVDETKIKNALDEKGKKYGSFNPKSVN